MAPPRWLPTEEGIRKAAQSLIQSHPEVRCLHCHCKHPRTQHSHGQDPLAPLLPFYEDIAHVVVASGKTYRRRLFACTNCGAEHDCLALLNAYPHLFAAQPPGRAPPDEDHEESSKQHTLALPPRSQPSELLASPPDGITASPPNTTSTKLKAVNVNPSTSRIIDDPSLKTQPNHDLKANSDDLLNLLAQQTAEYEQLESDHDALFAAHRKEVLQHRFELDEVEQACQVKVEVLTMVNEKLNTKLVREMLKWRREKRELLDAMEMLRGGKGNEGKLFTRDDNRDIDGYWSA
ncbi:hypothetical protein BJ508DRAFT_320652 [Ascobolus immersus RN42]|uniref:Uncharacterized protein n=1 Tax=Ascobolus immersus RN42 TaxID=1160509 RepID=A0A3N4ITW9_ASCIM|nr:hypothetical protein BJ508DRAFT_320652 [Ascobolus immersus RN42]